MTKYECDKCGACCKRLIVECDELDLMREPKLQSADRYYKDTTYDQALTVLQEGLDKAIVICGACPFLDWENLCSIYPTRPNACVAMQAGDEQCQLAREAAGLPPLEPITASA